MADESGEERYEEALGRAAAPVVGAFDLSGEWVNEAGSALDVVEEAGVVTGVFTSRTAGGGEPLVGQLSGYVLGELVGFVVKWDAMAVVAWTGRHRAEGGAEVVDARWHMTILAGGRPTFHAGTDRFTRPAVPARPSRPSEREAGDAVEPALG